MSYVSGWLVSIADRKHTGWIVASWVVVAFILGFVVGLLTSAVLPLG